MLDAGAVAPLIESGQLKWVNMDVDYVPPSAEVDDDHAQVAVQYTGVLGFRCGIRRDHLRLCHYADERIIASRGMGARLIGEVAKHEADRQARPKGNDTECHGCAAQRKAPSYKRNEKRAKEPGALTHADFKTGMHTPHCMVTRGRP